MPPVSSPAIASIPPLLVLVILYFLLLLLMSTALCACGSSESSSSTNQQPKYRQSEMTDPREVEEDASKVLSSDDPVSDYDSDESAVSPEVPGTSSTKVAPRKPTVPTTTSITVNKTDRNREREKERERERERDRERERERDRERERERERDRQKREKEVLQEGLRYYQTVAKDGRVKSISMYDRRNPGQTTVKASQTVARKKKGKKEKSKSNKSRTRRVHQEKEKQLLEDGLRYYQMVIKDKRGIKSVSQYFEPPAKKAAVTSSGSRRTLPQSKGKSTARTVSPTRTMEKKDSGRKGNKKEDELLQEGVRYYLEVAKNKKGVRSVSEYYQPSGGTTTRQNENNTRKHSHNHRRNR